MCVCSIVVVFIVFVVYLLYMVVFVVYLLYLLRLFYICCIFVLMLNTHSLKDTDYDNLLSSWWKDWGFVPPMKNFLPDNATGGLMVYDGEVPVAVLQCSEPRAGRWRRRGTR